MIRVFRNKKDLREYYINYDRKFKTLGLVPTLGYLHEGHLSLIKKAKQLCDLVVVSIFVNPTQFRDDDDYSIYPRSLTRDKNILRQLEPIYIFAPPKKVMYDEDFDSWVTVPGLANKLCGASRPGHFKGVATVVAKLLNITTPDYMFLGEKDYQQLVLLEKMIKDLDFRAKIVRCPTIREENGLAMSSRNQYLSAEEKEKASSIYKSLQLAQKLFQKKITDRETVINKMTQLIEESGGRIDYIEVVDKTTLEKLGNLKRGCRVLAAAYFGITRLIDNIGIR